MFLLLISKHLEMQITQTPRPECDRNVTQAFKIQLLIHQCAGPDISFLHVVVFFHQITLQVDKFPILHLSQSANAALDSVHARVQF